MQFQQRNTFVDSLHEYEVSVREYDRLRHSETYQIG